MQVGELQVDVVCSNFGDRTVLLVTHLNKIGTLVSSITYQVQSFILIIQLEVSHDALLGTSSTTFSVHTLLGKDEVSGIMHMFAIRTCDIHACCRWKCRCLDVPLQNSFPSLPTCPCC